MTGEDVKRQAMSELDRILAAIEEGGVDTDHLRGSVRRIRSALAPCRVLTAEERDEIAYILAWAVDKDFSPARLRKARALLTPEQNNG